MTAGRSEAQLLAFATALERMAAALPPGRALIPAICDVDAAERGALEHAIVEHAPVPLLLADRDGIVRYASAFMAEFGYRPEELVGDRLLDYVHPDDRERLAHLQERLALGERTSATIDIRWRRRTGTYLGVEARMRAGGDPQGPLAGGVVMGLRPLPEPWTGPAEIVATAHRHRVLADASDCGAAIVSGAEDSLGVVLDANARLGSIVGATTGQLVGTSLTSLVADRDVSRLRMALASTRTRARPCQLQVTLNESLGAGRWAEMALRSDAGGSEPNELVVRVRDITEQLRLVAELSGTVERLEQTNHELAEFARITAHDLSAPLLVVSRLVDLVSRGGEDSDDSATLNAIRNAVNRMSAMVDGAMGYAQSVESAPTRARLNLDEVLHRVLQTLSEEIANRSALVTLGELPTVNGDEPQLERLLLNLIANALKYSGIEPPRVRVEAHREPDAWRISVSDEGIGVPQAERARIFELFARSETTAAGRGIGLATSRRIVELHGGQIWVEPNDRGGSTFQFTLPSEPSGQVSEDQCSPRPSLGSPHLECEDVREAIRYAV